MLFIFFDKQAKQLIPHTTVTFYGDYVKMCEDVAPNFGDKRIGCCTVSHFLFYQEIFDQKQHGCSLPPTLFFSVSPIEDKTERSPFWHTWGHWGRIIDGAEYSHRRLLPGYI
jgi:hypothetical protein